MKVFRKLEEIKISEPLAIALGNFDGVHRGHMKLIERTIEEGKKRSLKTAVLTFSTHPKNLIPKEEPVKLLLSNKEKEEIIANLGVDYIFNIPFDQPMMTMSEREFAQKFLSERLHMKLGVTGHNYRFGYMAGGDVSSLKLMGDEFGYETVTIDPVIIDDNLVSSTMIRTMIAAGQVDRCMTYMGRNYTVAGEVVVGNKLGKTIGFPTSNLDLDHRKVTPPNGVYITLCSYGKHIYPSVTNVGNKPTIGEYERNAETHIFGFDKELYGKEIKVEFLLKLRDEVKFHGLQPLKEQILRDCREARNYHIEHGYLHE